MKKKRGGYFSNLACVFFASGLVHSGSTTEEIFIVVEDFKRKRKLDFVKIDEISKSVFLVIFKVISPQVMLGNPANDIMKSLDAYMK